LRPDLLRRAEENWAEQPGGTALADRASFTLFRANVRAEKNKEMDLNSYLRVGYARFQLSDIARFFRCDTKRHVPRMPNEKAPEMIRSLH
jgi:hypothetical protein